MADQSLPTELEAKFLRIPSDIRERLLAMGAKCVSPERLMRRKNLDTPDLKLMEVNGWIRVRDEGGKVTLSYKQVSDRTLTGTKEVSLVVDSFDATCQFLDAIGFVAKSYQETKRESWELDGVQIEIDTWPWIPSYLEIEAPDATALWHVAAQLGFTEQDALYGSVEIVYQHYFAITAADVLSWKEILFGDIPDWLAAKKKTS